MEVQSNRRIFLVGLGRFMLGAAAASIVKPAVLYSFPSEIRIANVQEQVWLAGTKLAAGNLGNVGLPSGWEQVGEMAYAFTLNMDRTLKVGGLPSRGQNPMVEHQPGFER